MFKLKKYIHFIWVGDKPLPKLAKKCIKSWQKYLPDFEIKKWSEENIDLNECTFIKEAYENKKYAFVADYVRAKALKEYGGIYFDTDMEITKDISKLLENETFLGVEDSNMIACGVWYEKNPNSFLSNKLNEYYKSFKKFPIDDLYSISIPRIITETLMDLGFNLYEEGIQVLEKDIHIYPRDYFYPLSYDHQNNLFTVNTCMIHYYDASWVPKWEQREKKIFEIFGKHNGQRLINLIRFFKRNVKRVIKIILFPFIKRKTKNKLNIKNNEIIENFSNELKRVKNKKTVVVHNPNWLGITSATKELFDNTLELDELDSSIIAEITNLIVNTKIKQIIFSGCATGWTDLIFKIKKTNPKIKIKILWHGSNAMHIEKYDWEVFNDIIHLLKNKTIHSIGFVKKSMYEFYLARGYNVEFVMNTVTVDIKIQKKESTKTKIGLYASGDRWVKNYYNQLSAASLVENSVTDVVPLSNKTIEFAKIIKANVTGCPNPIPREELFKRIAQNDINVYATFVDCAPMIPLESFELGVPCITASNHHYWEGTELEEYIVVDSVDNIIKIYDKIILCLKNKEKILKLYQEWKIKYDKEVKKNNKKFIEE